MAVHTSVSRLLSFSASRIFRCRSLIVFLRWFERSWAARQFDGRGFSVPACTWGVSHPAPLHAYRSCEETSASAIGQLAVGSWYECRNLSQMDGDDSQRSGGYITLESCWCLKTLAFVVIMCEVCRIFKICAIYSALDTFYAPLL